MYNTSPIRSLSHRLARGLVLAGALGTFAMAGISTVSAQTTAGSIFGNAPAGDTITVHSDTGAGRTVKVDPTGRYKALGMPMGNYTVTLKRGGKAIAEHINVQVVASRGSEVDFNCGATKCGKMTNTQ
jgi:hypothetical protein